MFLSDYPRALVNSHCFWWFPGFDALPVAPALAITLLLTRRRLSVSLLALPSRPFPRFPAAPLAAITLAGLLRMESLIAAFEQTRPRPRPICPALAPTSRLIFARVCSSLGRAHGRS